MPTEPKVAKTRKRGPHKKALSGDDAEPSKPTKKKRTGNKAGNKRKAADLQIEEPGESEVAKPLQVDHLDLQRIHPMIEHLKRHVLVAQALFPETLVLGVCLPNRSAGDTATFTVLQDGSSWTDADREQAMELRGLGIFEKLEANRRLHVP